MTDQTDYAEVKAFLGQARTGLDVALPALTTLVSEMFELIEQLVAENEELQDKVWSSDRLSHAHDPWEAEDA